MTDGRTTPKPISPFHFVAEDNKDYRMQGVILERVTREKDLGVPAETVDKFKLELDRYLEVMEIVV